MDGQIIAARVVPAPRERKSQGRGSRDQAGQDPGALEGEACQDPAKGSRFPLEAANPPRPKVKESADRESCKRVDPAIPIFSSIRPTSLIGPKRAHRLMAQLL
jgi:hypothetical protein